MTGRLALATAVLLATAGSAAAQSFRRCNHIQNWGANIHLSQHMQLAWSDEGNGDPDAADWGREANWAPGSPTSAQVIERAWRGHWNLDQSNPAVFLGTAHTDHGFSLFPDTVSLLHKKTNLPAGILGTTAPTAYFDLIAEVDMRILGDTRDFSPAGPLPLAGRCGHNAQTFGGMMVHELGHAYGYDHWLDWISMMNPGHRDVLSCEPPPVVASQAMNLTPDALTTQCHDIQYDLVPGVDFSGTPVRQTCALANGSGCSSVLNSLTHFAEGTDFALVLTQFTSFSNRDSFAGEVGYRMVVSLDLRADGGDREVGRGALTNWSAGATVTRTLGGRMNPTTDLPLAGRTYTLLVEFDPDHLVTETNESNNVIDTGIRYIRD